MKNLISLSHHSESLSCGFKYNSEIFFRHPKCNIFSSTVVSLCHTPGIVRRLSAICHLCIGGAPYISHKIMVQKPYFTFLTSSLKPRLDGPSYYARRLPKPWPS